MGGRRRRMRRRWIGREREKGAGRRTGRRSRRTGGTAGGWSGRGCERREGDSRTPEGVVTPFFWRGSHLEEKKSFKGEKGKDKQLEKRIGTAKEEGGDVAHKKGDVALFYCVKPYKIEKKQKLAKGKC